MPLNERKHQINERYLIKKLLNFFIHSDFSFPQFIDAIENFCFRLRF